MNPAITPSESPIANKRMVVLISCGSDQCGCCGMHCEVTEPRTLLRTYWIHKDGDIQEDGISVCGTCYVKHGRNEVFMIAAMKLRAQSVAEVARTMEAGLVAIADEIIGAITCGLVSFPDIPADAFLESFTVQDRTT